MKITKRQLRRIIKEEKGRLLTEKGSDPAGEYGEVKNAARDAYYALEAIFEKYGESTPRGISPLGTELEKVLDILEPHSTGY